VSSYQTLCQQWVLCRCHQWVIYAANDEGSGYKWLEGSSPGWTRMQCRSRLSPRNLGVSNHAPALKQPASLEGMCCPFSITCIACSHRMDMIY
jgi:hypothetical protein